MPPGRKNTSRMDYGRRPSYNGVKRGKKRKGFDGVQSLPLLKHPGSSLSQSQPLKRQGSSGLISKLFGNSNQQNPSQASLFSIPSAKAAVGGDLLQALKDPSSLTAMLANTQKVLSAAEQIGTMVQQYGPLIKNLPEMWKIYRSMSDTAVTTETEDGTKEVTEKKTAKPKNKREKADSTEGTRKRLTVNDERSVQKKKRKKDDSSTPKLYI